MTLTDEVFEPLTLAEITAATTKEAADKIDHDMAARIATLPVGGGFRTKRTEGEATRTLKTRIGRAARSVFRELAWYPQPGNLMDGKPASYIVRVKSIDLKAQAEAQNGQNGASQAAPPTTPGPVSTPTPPTEDASSARVRGR